LVGERRGMVDEASEIGQDQIPTFDGAWRKQGDSRKPSTASLTMLKPLTVWITTNCRKL